MKTTIDLWLAGAALVAVAAGFYRWAWPHVSQAARTIHSALVTLGGRDEIRDPGSGRVVAPAVPPLGVRLGGVESALAELARTNRRMDAVEHTQADVMRIQDRHNARLITLETGRLERTVVQLDHAATLTAQCQEHAEACAHLHDGDAAPLTDVPVTPPQP